MTFKPHSASRPWRSSISDAKVAEVKARYPSCAQPWTVEMVEKAWPRLSFLFPRRAQRTSASLLQMTHDEMMAYLKGLPMDAVIAIAEEYGVDVTKYGIERWPDGDRLTDARMGR